MKKYLIAFTLNLMTVVALTSSAYATHPSDTVKFLMTRVHNAYKLQPGYARFAEQQIAQGTLILESLLRANEAPEVLNESQRMKNILSLMWAFYHLGFEQQGKAFEQGALSVEDPDGRIFNYLRSSQFSFERNSSHLRYLKKYKGVKHYGIDILGEALTPSSRWSEEIDSREAWAWNPTSQGGALDILPARKSHILFGIIPASPELNTTSQRLFIKFEDYGLKTVYGIIMHGVELVKSQYRIRIQGKTNHETEVAYRERLDEKVKRLYQEFLNYMAQSLTKEEQEQWLTRSTTIADEMSYGAMSRKLQYLVNRLEEKQAQNPEASSQFAKELERIADEFAEALAKKGYTLMNDLKERIGDEVLVQLYRTSTRTPLDTLLQAFDFVRRELLQEYQISPNQALAEFAPREPRPQAPARNGWTLVRMWEDSVRYYTGNGTYQAGDWTKAGSQAVAQKMKGAIETTVRSTLNPNYQFGDLTQGTISYAQQFLNRYQSLKEQTATEESEKSP